MVGRRGDTFSRRGGEKKGGWKKNDLDGVMDKGGKGSGERVMFITTVFLKKNRSRSKTWRQSHCIGHNRSRYRPRSRQVRFTLLPTGFNSGIVMRELVRNWGRHTESIFYCLSSYKYILLRTAVILYL